MGAFENGEFQACVDYLDGLQRRKWHGGLERMEELVRILGLSEFVWGDERPAYYHVAGTNGKGSTTSYLQSLLVKKGFRTGAAASPYVYDVRERVQVDHDLISHDDFARLVARLQETDEVLGSSPLGMASAFEMKTALGFLLWKEKGVRAAAVEVGLGGRLDATNVLVPAASIIVSIGWDHMDVLGNSLELIAGEKAGIIKEGKPVICGKLPESALEVVRGKAKEQGSELWEFGRQITLSSRESDFDVSVNGCCFRGLKTAIYGDVQRINAAIAISALSVSGVQLEEDEVREALSSTRWPGRFEEYLWGGIQVVLDGAHNVPAAENLAETLAARFPGKRIGIVLGMIRGHDPSDVVGALHQVANAWAIVSSPGPRGRSAEETASLAQMPRTHSESMEEAFECLKKQSCEVICVTGSFYILGEAKALVS